jgi:hypothetical protein
MNKITNFALVGELFSGLVPVAPMEAIETTDLGVGESDADGNRYTFDTNVLVMGSATF